MRKKKSPLAGSKALVIAVVLGLLIVFSAVQAFELASLKERINTELSNLQLASKGNETSPSETLQKNLQNLPTMVGGC